VCYFKRVERGLGPSMGSVGLGWIGLGSKLQLFVGWVGSSFYHSCANWWREESVFGTLLVAFCQHLIVNPVLDTKHKYTS